MEKSPLRVAFAVYGRSLLALAGGAVAGGALGFFSQDKNMMVSGAVAGGVSAFLECRRLVRRNLGVAVACEEGTVSDIKQSLPFLAGLGAGGVTSCVFTLLELKTTVGGNYLGVGLGAALGGLFGIGVAHGTRPRRPKNQEILSGQCDGPRVR